MLIEESLELECGYDALIQLRKNGFSCENIVYVKGREKRNMEEENNEVIITNVYGDICLRKARRKRQKLLVQELFYDYANNTTLHGLPYMTRRGVTLIEKIFWLLTFIASVSLCLYLISKVWFKWQSSPVIVTVSEHLVSVSEVPFPSVTICPQQKCKVSIYNYTDEKIGLYAITDTDPVNLTTMERIAMFEDISLVCKNTGKGLRKFVDIYPRNFSDSSVADHIMKVSPNYTDVFDSCKIHGKSARCNQTFSKVLTKEGVCYNMNSLAADEIFRIDRLQKNYSFLYATRRSSGWTLANGYETLLGTFQKMIQVLFGDSYYPLRGAESGTTPDVEVTLLDYTYEHDHICNALYSGFKVYIQHPADLPQSSLYYYAVINGQVSSMALSFSLLNTSEDLRTYDPEIRQCYFPDERYLKYFNNYTANNCWIECLTNFTFRFCGCVEFYMPHNDSVPICTEQVVSRCRRAALVNLKYQELIENKPPAACHCLPSCNSVDYEAEILKTDYNLKQVNKVNNIIKNKSKFNLTGKNYSKLEIYYKRPRFVSMRRSELFGVTDFLANCGGLLGLFLGFSFLSLVEIFYFLTLRLYRTLKEDFEEEKAQELKEKEENVVKY